MIREVEHDDLIAELCALNVVLTLKGFWIEVSDLIAFFYQWVLMSFFNMIL